MGTSGRNVASETDVPGTASFCGLQSFHLLVGWGPEANLFIAHTLGYDAVVECDVGVSGALFVNIKSLRRFVVL